MSGRRAGRGDVLLQAGVQGGGEVLGAFQLDAQLLHLLGGGLLVGPHALQQGLALAGVEAVGGVQEVAHLVQGEAERLSTLVRAKDGARPSLLHSVGALA